MLPRLIDKIIDTESLDTNNLLSVPGKIYTFLNPVSYLEAIKQEKIFTLFDGILVDGGLLAKSIYLVYHKIVGRRSFDMTSLAPILFEYAQSNYKTIYIVASKQEQLEKSISFFKRDYPDLIIKGFRNGYFTDDDTRLIEIKKIIKENPDFLIVGMGIVAQEKFLLEAKNLGYKGIGFTCGGFIHQTAENQMEYYPKWINRMNLRFLYRMYKEPHTRKRYIQAGLIFPLRFIAEKFMN